MSTIFTFCENTPVTPGSRWHIRRLTHVGRKLTGGVDTSALCGAKVQRDVDAQITYHHLQNCCSKCSQAYGTVASE
jgi:hypothetical protein